MVAKQLADGRWSYYWQPSARLKAAGWEALTLPAVLEAAIAAAKARNEEVARWQAGGAPPQNVAPLVHRSSVADLLRRYRAHLDERVEQHAKPPRNRNPEKGRPMAPSTRLTYEWALRVFETWATDPAASSGRGNLPLASITAERVKKLKGALMTPDEDGRVHHNRAHGILRVIRAALSYAKAEGMIPYNPAENFGLSAPPPRDQVWDVDGGRGDMEAFVAAAEWIGYPSVALAVEVAEYTGQRRADVIGLTRAQWQIVRLQDRALVDQLRGDDDELMGIVLHQGKTNKAVGIPILRPLRTRIEEAFAANAARAIPTSLLIVDDQTGLPWKKRRFASKVSEARAVAIDPPPEAIAAGLSPRPSLADLQFRDLRRTRVVRMAEAGIDEIGISSITGHDLNTIREMLKVYRPATTRQAAIVTLSVYGKQSRKTDATKGGKA
ncbi:MAG: hypothetical protein QHC65_17990 [Sphingomonas sp.]|nr:hypothetical protein [Sphingomonas sp.]MDX3886316.1 hypothetical protein [Sphingomonas sp.]